MKKLMATILVIIMCIAMSACGQTKNIEFPFEVSDIESVATYRYNVPADAEKKILTESEDIEEVVNVLSGITLKDKKTEEYTGATVTSFRFNLTDGTSYDVIYVAEAVKSGTLSFPGDDTKWFTSADIGGLWDIGDSDAVKAEMSELPSVKKAGCGYAEQEPTKPIQTEPSAVQTEVPENKPGASSETNEKGFTPLAPDGWNESEEAKKIYGDAEQEPSDVLK